MSSASGSVPARAVRHAALVLSPRGTIASDTVAAIAAQIATATRAGHRRVVIDLRAVELVETAALSELCGLLRAVGDGPVGCAIVGADPRVRWTLDICRIDSLALHPTLAAAITGRSLAASLRTLLHGSAHGARPTGRAAAGRRAGADA